MRSPAHAEGGQPAVKGTHPQVSDFTMGKAGGQVCWESYRLEGAFIRRCALPRDLYGGEPCSGSLVRNKRSSCVCGSRVRNFNWQTPAGPARRSRHQGQPQGQRRHVDPLGVR